MSMPESMTRNAAYMTAGSVAQKVISFAYFALIARYLGPSDTGKYFLALSLATIFVVFVDLGFTTAFIKEAAKDRQRLLRLLDTVLSAKVFFAVVAYVALNAATWLLGYSAELRLLVAVSGITMLFDSLHLTLYGALRSLGDLKYEAFSVPASQIATLAFGSFFLFFHFPLIYLIMAFTIPSAMNAVFAGAVLAKKYGIRPAMRFESGSFRALFALAWPFTIAAILARLYSYADTIILSKLAGDAVVGWYSIAHKVTFAFQFIPLSLTAALYPTVSEYFEKHSGDVARVFEQSVKYLLLLSFPIAIGIALLAKPIVIAIWPEFTSAILPLQILIVGLIFSFLSFPIGAMLNAGNRQATQTTIVGCVLALNVLLNLALVPSYGAVGSAISALLGNVFLTMAGYAFIPAIAKISHTRLLLSFCKIGAAAGGMGWLVWYLAPRVHFIVAIFAGAALYGFLVFITRIVTWDDVRNARLRMRLEV